MTGSPSSWPDPLPIPAGGRAAGRVQVPGSKSFTHRYLNLALLAGRPAVIERPLYSEDTRLFLAALEACGFAVEAEPREARLTPGRELPAQAEIACGNAGTMYRFLVASLAALPGRWRLDGVARLRERPVGPLVEALRPLGARIEYAGAPGYAPLVIHGGSLEGGRTTLDAGESSQYLSALLMAGLRARRPVEVEVRALTSAPYVDLTLSAIAAFGGSAGRDGDLWRVAPTRLEGGRRRVEADFSAAAYPAAAAALTGGRVELSGVARDSAQGDRRFLEVLARMGARIEWPAQDRAVVEGGAGLDGLERDFSDMPDQVPTFAALAPFARGTSRVTGVPHLRIKESDRLAAMAGELRRVGARVEELEAGLVVEGSWHGTPPPREPVAVRTHGDHRIAMSLALVGLRRPGVRVRRPGVVAKSYPGFWDDFFALLPGAPEG